MHGHIPVDALDEGLLMTEDISRYKAIYVSGSHLRRDTAERLAKLLNSIYSGSMSQQSGSSFSADSGSSGYSSGFGGDASVAPGMSRESIGSGISSSNFQPTSNNSGENRESQISTVTMGGEANSLLGNVRVVADEENNALMIYSSGMQYRIIKTALEQLDIEATQVIIEASILEVTLTDKLRYGLEWTFNGSVGDDYTGTGLLTNGATTALAPTVPGFSYAITNSIGDISAVLNALSEDNLINVISTPSVMVKNI